MTSDSGPTINVPVPAPSNQTAAPVGNAVQYNGFIPVQPLGGGTLIPLQTGPEEPILRYFDYKHLPQHLQDVSKPFHDLAHSVIMRAPRNPERSVALRKLLESKDAAVRSALP